MNWTGQDWALLLGGVAVFITSIGTLITNMVTLIRVGAIGTKVDGLLVDRDAANMAMGELKGRQAGDEASEQRAVGRKQERELNRETTALSGAAGSLPVPVADDRVAVAAEKGADANVRIADAAEAAGKKPG